MESKDDTQEDYVLGIDMGTTSLKIVVVGVRNSLVVYSCSKTADWYIVHDSNFSEQDVSCMIDQLDECVASIPYELANRIIGIGICGQVHGVLCWSSSNKPWKAVNNNRCVIANLITPYYNWQDSRCDSKFLQSLPAPDSHLTVHTGYGCCTLFWLVKNKSAVVEKMNRSCTIADFVVTMLCDLDVPQMSAQSAASWGYFKTETNEWNEAILKSNAFPTHLLPGIGEAGSIAGYTTQAWHGVRAGIAVGVALGDLQASVLAVLRDDDCAICNISTSAQIVFVAKDFHPSSGEQERTLAKIVPYFGSQYILEGACLNGGNAIALFVDNIHKFMTLLQPASDKDALWAKLMEEALANETDLNFQPTFLGERYDPQLRGSITNMRTDNMSMGQIFRALCRGVILNLQTIIPMELLREKQMKKMIATGSALVRNRVLQVELERLYPMPIEYAGSVDSPYGAALAVLKTITKQWK